MSPSVKSHKNWREFCDDWCVEHMFFEIGESLYEIHFPRSQRATIRKITIQKAMSILGMMPKNIDWLDENTISVKACDSFMDTWDKAMGKPIQMLGQRHG